jgi:RNA polymerase sigma-70 factor (sigma-E family)
MAVMHVDFDQFVRANLDGLVRTAYMIVWDLKEAEDLVQDCLFKVARRWDRVGAMEDPLAYTRRVLLHLSLRQAGRRARRRAELQVTEVEDAAAVALVGLETREELLEALGQLPPRQRAAIVLRYFLDLSEAETARALGCSAGTVKSNTSKGLTRLRETLIPDPPRTEVFEP